MIEIKFYYGALGCESVEVPYGYEAIQDILEDNRSIKSCERLLSYITDTKDMWEMTYNASFIQATRKEVKINSHYCKSKVCMSTTSFVSIIDNWMRFLKNSKKLMKVKIQL